jgi:O-antigen ligase
LTTKTKSAGQLGLKIALAVLLVATIITGAVLIGGESSLNRLAETAASGNFTTNRTHIWSVTLDVIKNHLPFGTGYGGYGVAYTAFDSSNGLERVEQAHNDYLQVVADAGIIGLIIGIFFVYQLFRTGLKNIKTSNSYRRGVAVGALGGCFAILVHSLFDFVLHTTAVGLLFITLISLVVVSGRKDSEDEDDLPKKKRRRSSAASITPIEVGRKSQT